MVGRGREEKNNYQHKSASLFMPKARENKSIRVHCNDEEKKNLTKIDVGFCL